LDDFQGYHSEWNLGSPGGWDYQRTTQEIGKEVWERLNRISDTGIELDFDHPLLYPVRGFADMLVEAHRQREGSNPGLICLVAEEETLLEVTENRNLVDRLDKIDGISGALLAPHWLELENGRVCYKGQPVSTIFMDFNTDVLLDLHRKHGLTPLLQAVREGRVINPRGTEPINVKSMFEVLTGPYRGRFHPETVSRTPWTRQFYQRSTEGPQGELIKDLVEWTRINWSRLVLKPERGYSGKGVRVGEIDCNVDDCIKLALSAGDYIVQERIPLNTWAEDNADVDADNRKMRMARFQTDFRCLFGPDRVFGFLCRFGGVPTNVGSGGGVQPLGVLKSETGVKEAVDKINRTILEMDYDKVMEVVEARDQRAIDEKFTYLLGPIKIALRPRIVSSGQLKGLETYCRKLWEDCLTLEKMWMASELDHMINIDPEELEIAKSQPWKGNYAIIASDGLFSFGAHPE
jgi:hypothetical protein